MDPDLDIFTSTPEEINTKIKFDKLRNIDIVKDYQLEPFKIKKISYTKYIILFIFIFIFILIILNKKNKKIF